MRLIFLFVLASTFGTSTCYKKGAPSNIPKCIQSKIDSLQKAPVQNPPAIITRYIYQGKKVYLFNAPCCDQFSSLYNEDCVLICLPDGGIAGRGDGKCADFSTAATDEKLLWQDLRIRN